MAAESVINDLERLNNGGGGHKALENLGDTLLKELLDNDCRPQRPNFPTNTRLMRGRDEEILARNMQRTSKWKQTSEAGGWMPGDLYASYDVLRHINYI